MNYAKIVPCDIANGPSVRVTLFVQGCNHHCPGCQNPTTWDPNGGQPFTDETLDKIVDLLRPDYIQGLTLTGGDPMLPENEPDIAHIIWKVRLLFGDKKDIWVWTGYILKELRRRAQNDDDEGMLSPTYEMHFMLLLTRTIEKMPNAALTHKNPIDDEIMENQYKLVNAISLVTGRTRNDGWYPTWIGMAMKIVRLKSGESAGFLYIKDNEGHDYPGAMHTSCVVDYYISSDKKNVIVQTENTIYKFEKIEEN